MKEFPKHLVPTKKNTFPLHRNNRILTYLRKELYDLMLSGDENNYFDIDIFNRKYELSQTNSNIIFQIVIEELENLGWKTKKSFGDTGLFIYSTELPPPSCFSDEF